jgi:hypothetical protein
LTKNEIWLFLSVKCDKEIFERCLSALEDEKRIVRFEEYYSLENDFTIFNRRIQGNILAKSRLKKARQIAKFLGNFPFVESVFISGSLSKNFTLPNGDLDFFIVTASDRLWIARSLMHIFKKFTFLFKAEHSFCMNYYLSLDMLNVSHKNLFTATELATLKPAFIQKGWEELYHHNVDWVNAFLPNILDKIDPVNNLHRKSVLSRVIESVLNIGGGKALNMFCFKATQKKWINKWKRKGFNVEICKKSIGYHYNTPLNYPINFPDKIISSYEKILKAQDLLLRTEKIKAS